MDSPMRQAASGRLKKRGMFGLMTSGEVVDFWGKKFGVSNASGKLSAPIRGEGSGFTDVSPKGRMLSQAEGRNLPKRRKPKSHTVNWPTGQEPAKPKDIMESIWAKHKARLNK